MAQVAVEVGGRRHELSCRDGEEQRLQLLAKMVDRKARDVAGAIGRASEARELLLTALLLADELDETRGALAAMQAEDGARAAAIERCADRIEGFAARLEKAAVAA